MKLSFPPHYFEKNAWCNEQLVCGIDEVGRGCLAGPVVVAAVVLPLHCSQYFTDSKKTTLARRHNDFEWIMRYAHVVLAYADHSIIDQKNIYRTTQDLMHRAFTMLMAQQNLTSISLRYLISDAMPLHPHRSLISKNLEIYHFNHGESISTTIAAASIVAKVTRDRIMSNMTSLFPSFSFDKHKGYGTKDHSSQIQSYGLTIIHRRSFITQARKENHDEQQHLLF